MPPSQRAETNRSPEELEDTFSLTTYESRAFFLHHHHHHHLPEVVVGQRLVEARGGAPVVVGPILAMVARGMVLGLGPRLPRVAHVSHPFAGLTKKKGSVCTTFERGEPESDHMKCLEIVRERTQDDHVFLVAAM